MLDESLEILAAAWSGEPVRHRGEHYTVDGMSLLPRPVQRPGVPVWVAGYYGKPRPVRRAARHQGFFPLGVEHPEQLAEIVADLDGAAQGGRQGLHRALRRRRRPPARRRSGPLRRSRRHLVARRVPMGRSVGRPGARCDPRRPGGPGVACPRDPSRRTQPTVTLSVGHHALPARGESADAPNIPALDRPDGGVRRWVYSGGRVGIAGVGRIVVTWSRGACLPSPLSRTATRLSSPTSPSSGLLTRVRRPLMCATFPTTRRQSILTCTTTSKLQLFS